MRGYTNAAGGGTLASIAFDREAFAEYLEQLGSINDVRDRLQDFLDSVAYSFTSGTITADKFVTAGNNLLPRLDSFEDEQGRSIPMFPNNGVINAAIPVIASDPYYPAPHGETVLKITTPFAPGPFTFYLNPYNNNDSTWFKLGKMDYWFSYYLYTTSPLAVTGSIDLLNTASNVISSVSFSITEAQGWLRFSNNFTLASNSDVKFRVRINQGGRNLYLDAIQVEYKYITTPVPTNFAPGGKVIIEGGNIRANSISASDAVFQDAAIIDANIANINAAKIRTGILDTNIVTIGDADDGLMTLFDNKITFYHPSELVVPRVSIGKLVDDPLPENQVWGMQVVGADGTATLFNEDGITYDGIVEGMTKADFITMLGNEATLAGSKIKDNGIDGQVAIAANSIVSDNIAAGAITTNTLAANAVTAEKITANTINADHLNTTITTSKKILLGSGSTVNAGIDGYGNSGNNVRFWAGADDLNKTNAPFRVTQDGKLYATGANIIAGYATESSLSEIENRVNQTEASLTIQNDQIQSKVTAGYVDSKILEINTAKPNRISNLETSYEYGTLINGEPALLENHIRSRKFYTIASGDVTIQCSDIYQAMFVFYDSNYNYVFSQAFTNSTTFYNSTSGFFKIVLRKTAGGTLLPYDIENSLLKIANESSASFWTPYYGDLSLEEQKELYIFNIRSTTGLVFDTDNIITLQAQVFLDNIDIASEFEDKQFVWSRYSKDLEKDTLFNQSLKIGPILNIDSNYLDRTATYECEFTIYEFSYILTFDGSRIISKTNSFIQVIRSEV